MPDNVHILFFGDVIGRPGRMALRRTLPSLKKKYRPDIIVANGENAAGGIGITPDVCRELLTQVHVLTSGNHIWDKKDAVACLDEEARLLRPANYPPQNPGKSHYLFTRKEGRKIGILNLQGRVFMEPVDCPFQKADEMVEILQKETPIILVDLHAEATSEKQAMGWYLDGRVSAVVGTHTHVQTADERILPGGTAYITDVGMVGGYDSIIGIKKDQAIQRFLTSRPQRFEPGKGDALISMVFLQIDPDSGKALDIQRESIVENANGSE